jgi:hypothetical protein
MAIVGTLRTATRRNVPLSEAYDAWRETERATVESLIKRSLSQAQPATRILFQKARSGKTQPTENDLRQLERAGLFVDRLGGRYELNPTVFSLRQQSHQFEPAILEMFGRFRMTIDGRTVNFARRRDAQIVQFLALRPNGAAKRSEIIDTFWPDVPREFAAHRLRQAWSSIRRAITECKGPGAADHYLVREGDTIGLRLDAITTSAHRFQAHANIALKAYARGQAKAARGHATVALRLYKSGLLSGEAPQPTDRHTQDFAAIASTLRTCR